MEKEYKEVYKIGNEIQLDTALRHLDALGYEWLSGRGLTDWKPDIWDYDFPIVLTTGIFSKPNTITYGLLMGSGIDYKQPFDNLLDAPDYSKGEEGEENETAHTADLKDGEPSWDKVTKYTVRLTNGESIYIRKYNGTLNADFVSSKGDTDRLTAKQLFMYLTGEEVEAELFMNGKYDIRQGLDDIETIEVDGTHKDGEFKSDVRFTVIADGKHVTIDRFPFICNDYHLFGIPFIYDGNELTFDELLAFITREGDVGYCDNFEEIQSISIVAPDREDKEDEEDEEDEITSDNISDESDETKFVIRLTNRRVLWRVPYNSHMSIEGPKNSFKSISKDYYAITELWDYHLTVEELIEALGLIDLSELASISIVD